MFQIYSSSSFIAYYIRFWICISLNSLHRSLLFVVCIFANLAVCFKSSIHRIGGCLYFSPICFLPYGLHMFSFAAFMTTSLNLVVCLIYVLGILSFNVKTMIVLILFLFLLLSFPFPTWSLVCFYFSAAIFLKHDYSFVQIHP